MENELFDGKCFKRAAISFAIILQLFAGITNVFGQQKESVELSGDVVEYSIDGNVVIVEGNVEVSYKGATITCDKIEFERDTKIANANGNVILSTTSGEISGKALRFNFEKMEGDFNGAKIVADPFYGSAETASMINKDEIVLRNGYVTTSDYDNPGYRLKAKSIQVFPKDKLVARNIKMVLGKVPIFYIPWFTQNLRDTKPRVIITPGYDKDWGLFLLQAWRYYLNDDFKGTIHLDYRERKDFASGIDLDYRTEDYGSGIIRTYYMNERNITSDHPWQDKPSPTIEKERFKVEWRHKWKIDDKTNAIAQYYKLSDSTFLKDYFEKEYDKDPSPDTYFLLTRALPLGMLSFRTDARVNRFEAAVERLPEVRYDLSNKQIYDTGLFFKNTSIFSNLVKKSASPSEDRQKTMRMIVDSSVSYPMKVGFIEMNPYVGGENTYYSRAKDRSNYGVIRGQLKTGASLNTKFYRVYDIYAKKFGLDINRLRHIIAPSIAYEYKSHPTIPASSLDEFDGLDTITNRNSINFALENKFQTKREGKSVDMARAIISTPFRLKEDPSPSGFDGIDVDIDFKPLDWLTFYFDSHYDTAKDRLSTANFDLYINGKDDKWSVGIGKRWDREVDDQVTTQYAYKFNSKWGIKLYQRFDLKGGILKEQDYVLTRDLHSWIMDMCFNDKNESGSEVMVVFTLKAFPDMAVDASASFNQRRAGAQNN